MRQHRILYNTVQKQGWGTCIEITSATFAGLCFVLTHYLLENPH